MVDSATKSNGRFKDDYPFEWLEHDSAEVAVLGGCLRDNESITESAAKLAPDDFRTQAHQIIWAAMIELWETGEGVVPVSLAELLKRRQMIDDVGGYPYLAALWTANHTGGLVGHYANIVKDDSIRRRVNSAAVRIARLSVDPTGSGAAIAEEALRQFSIIANTTGSALAEESSTNTWPAPPSDLAFHGLAGEIVRRIDSETEADPIAVLTQFLASFGSAVGRTAFCRVGGVRHYSNIYAVLVGRTAKGRKGTAMGWVKALMAEADRNWFEKCIAAGLSSNEGLIHALNEQVDGLGSGKKLLAIEEEFAAVLQHMNRDGNTLSAGLRQLWDNDSARTMTRHNPLHVTNCHFSLIGHVTAEELRRCLGSGQTANGLANRFLWPAVRRSKLLPDGGNLVDLSALQEQVRLALDHARLLSCVRRDCDAQALWREAYPALTAERPGALGFVTSRAEAQSLRLSLLYALLDCSDTIRRRHLEAALELWMYCQRSCEWIFGDSTGNPEADVILAALRGVHPRGLTMTELSGLFGRNRSAQVLRRALDLLEAVGAVIPGKPAAGGNPAVGWRYNPNGTKSTNPTKAEVRQQGS